MPAVDLVVSCTASSSIRARQVSSMFDVPAQNKLTRRWTANLPLEGLNWNIGLICGPSGCGKSQLLKYLWPKESKRRFEWSDKSVIDDFSDSLSVQEITDACSAVGFNTIPSWLKPFHVLSNGEKFRVEMARHIAESASDEIIVIDEFTSIIDRQVAQIASHAIQKKLRRDGRRAIFASCHLDIIEWLRPDFIFWPESGKFERGFLQCRPRIEATIERISTKEWGRFAPYHYMSAKLNPTSVCFGLRVHGELVAFLAVLHFPHARVKNIKREHRSVVLPDYQGLGLVFALKNRVAAAYKARGYRFRSYPAHPAFIRAHKKPNWTLTHQPGIAKPTRGKTSRCSRHSFGERLGATFEYTGPAASVEDALCILGGI